MAEIEAVRAELQKQLDMTIGKGQQVVPAPPDESGPGDVTLVKLGTTVAATFGIADESILASVSPEDLAGSLSNLTAVLCRQLGDEIVQIGLSLKNVNPEVVASMAEGASDE